MIKEIFAVIILVVWFWIFIMSVFGMYPLWLNIIPVVSMGIYTILTGQEEK